MNYVTLGNTGLTVTELCFGALPIGPNQKNVPVDAATDVMSLALTSGITFFDTAQMYGTYSPIKAAMERTGKRPVIATKSVAASYEDMDAAVKEALEKLGVEYIDIFFLHAARVGTDVFDVRAGALKRLIEYKDAGVVRAVGISAHAVDVVELAAERADIDVVFAILNKTGMGILRGGREDMERAVERCFENGKGVMLMKALAGGNLIDDYVAAMDYIRAFSHGRAAIAVGMVAEPEVVTNIRYFGGGDVSAEIAGAKGTRKTLIVVGSLCKSCGKCVEACHSSAISMDKYAVIDAQHCLKCGYCVAACPEFAIRMV